jgi:TolA-binding protein
MRFLQPRSFHLRSFSAMAVTLLVWCVACGGSSTALLAADANDDYRLAVSFYKDKKFKLAAEQFREFIARHPNHRQVENAMYFRGLALINLEDHKTARDVLRKYRERFPKGRDAATALYWVGQCSFLIDDFTAAEKELSQFVLDQPDSPLNEHALPLLGESLLRQGKFDAAIPRLLAALVKYPSGEAAADARFGLGQAYDSTGRSADAIAAWKILAADAAGPRAADAQLAIASRLFEDRQYADSAAAYRDFAARFASDAKRPQALLRAGYALYYANDFAAAAREFDTAASVSADIAGEATYWKGRSLKAAGDLPAAIAVFKAAYEARPHDAESERLLFQWADCTLRLGDAATAMKLFVQAADRFPKGALADESLYFACAASLTAQHPEAAKPLLDRLDREFPRSKYRLRTAVLRGRYHLMRADAAAKAVESAPAGQTLSQARLAALKPEAEAAVVSLKLAAEGTDRKDLIVSARYYWSLALQRLQRHAEVLAVLEPTFAILEADKGPIEFSSAFIVHASSALAAGRSLPAESPDRKKRFAAAAAAARKYRDVFPQGDMTGQAISAIALAAVHAGDKPTAETALQELQSLAGSSPELERTFIEAGDVAASNQDWPWSEQLYSVAAGVPQPKRPAASMLGLADALMRQRKFDTAATTYARFLERHGNDPSADEAAFGQGAALREAGDATAAVAAFQKAFARPGESDFIFLSGVEAARLFARLKQIDDADRQYAAVDERFPNARQSAELLDEWAAVNYEAGEYARSDEVFRRLLNRFPDSPLADQARLSLAESDLVNNKVKSAQDGFAALWSRESAPPDVRERAAFQLLRLAVERKDWSEVTRIATAYTTAFPNGVYRTDAEMHRGQAEIETGTAAAALDRLQRLKSGPTPTDKESAEAFPFIWVLIAEAQSRLKKYADVAATAAEFRQSYPDSPFAYLLAEIEGRTLKSQARFAEAREAFGRVLSDRIGGKTETAARCQFEIAECFLFEKNFKEALLAYSKVDVVFEVTALKPAALYQIGACHESLQERDNAEKTYRRLVSDYPQSEFATKAQERLKELRKRS